MRIIQQRWKRSSTWPCCTKHKVICDKAEPSFSKPSMAATSNSVTLIHTEESINNLIASYEAWNKPDKAQECRAKLARIEDIKE